MPTEHLRFSPDVLRRLGEELIPHADQGIIELVRNAYDADAITCRVELIDTDQPGGKIIVTDDGTGMTASDISRGWLVLGRSAKSSRSVTPLGRIPAGDKGLGRLAALRLGATATLRTRPAAEPGTEHCLVLDWPRFDDAQVIEDVELEIQTTPAAQPQGTTIEVTSLSVRLGKREVQRLSRSLLLLADPFDDSTGFHPELVSPAYRDLERRVRDAYFDEAEFHLIARLEADGHASAQVFDRMGDLRWEGNLDEFDRRRRKPARAYQTSPTTLELWAFNLNPQTFTLGVPRVELQEWLEAIGGVHLYHRGLRVHPYGDPGHDWLDMNLARVRNPELRPSTNNSIGRVVVPDLHNELLQKTDRSGFVENEAFSELRRFAQDALDWMAANRLAEREARRTKDRREAPTLVSAAQESLARQVEQLPTESRDVVRAAVQHLETAREQEAQALREDVQLYRTLGTVGTTSAIFAHESAKPVTTIEQMAGLINRSGRRLLGEDYDSFLAEPVGHILRSARALKSYAQLPLRFLIRGKRRTTRVDIHTVINDIAQLFEPFVRDAKIDLKLELVDSNPTVRASIASIEAILANLITNAIYSLASWQELREDRDLVIRTGIMGEDRLIIRVLDSGPGIVDIHLDDIWLPGQTSRPGGTGLGLTIVRDTVTDLGGKIFALPNGELGGAEFVIELPVISEVSQ